MSAKSIAAFERHMAEKHGHDPAKSLRAESQRLYRYGAGHAKIAAAALKKAASLKALADALEEK